MRNPFVLFASLFVSWVGAAGSWLMAHSHLILSFVCGIGSLVASWYAIRVSRAKLKLLRHQIDKLTKGRGLLFGVPLVLLLLFAGCASYPTGFDRSFYNVVTNYTPHVVVQTNTVVITNTVPVVVERTNTVVITNELGAVAMRTNLFNVTNLTTVLTLQTNVVSLTNYVPQVQLEPKPEAEASIRATGGAFASLFGPMFGALGTALAAGLYHMRMRVRNKKLLDESGAINAALVQTVETAREVLKTTPQGQALDQQLKGWMVAHQGEAALIGAISQLVQNHVSNDAAKAMARLIADTQAAK